MVYKMMISEFFKIIKQNLVLLVLTIVIVFIGTIILFLIDITFGFHSRNNKIKKYFHDHTGLMFKKRDCAKRIVFEFDKPVTKPIHSWFVKFPFNAKWYLDDELIDEKIIMPWVNSYKPNKPFNKLIEQFCDNDAKN